MPHLWLLLFIELRYICIKNQKICVLLQWSYIKKKKGIHLDLKSFSSRSASQFRWMWTKAWYHSWQEWICWKKSISKEHYRKVSYVFQHENTGIYRPVLLMFFDLLSNLSLRDVFVLQKHFHFHWWIFNVLGRGSRVKAHILLYQLLFRQPNTAARYFYRQTNG